MMKNQKIARNIDEYISGCPKNVQSSLKLIRSTVKKLAPTAEEKIAYSIPTFKLNKNLVHFAAYEHHIGFYPGSSGVSNFKKELAKYKTSKGSIQFPIDKPIPVALITKIVKFRIKENK